MKRLIQLLAIAVAVAIFSTASAAETTPPWLEKLLAKDEITVAITDSGLGGLSVVAAAEQKLAQARAYKKVNLLFVNALFTNGGGYNSLQTREEKVKVFSSALQSIEDNWHPDVILVACNTLSVLYRDTEFVHTSKTPVVGIVEDGVAQIAEKLLGHPKAKNILFATQTTVDEGSHKKGLLADGVKPEQFQAQACPELTLYIEKGFDSPDTEMLIDAYVDEALSAEKPGDPLYVSFNCTHFGYALEAWQKAFEERGVKVAGFLNPNSRMVDFLLPQQVQGRFDSSEITVQAISMTEIPQDRRSSIGRWLHGVSPKTEAALQNYQWKKELFQWQGLVK